MESRRERNRTRNCEDKGDSGQKSGSIPMGKDSKESAVAYGNEWADSSSSNSSIDQMSGLRDKVSPSSSLKPQSNLNPAEVAEAEANGLFQFAKTSSLSDEATTRTRTTNHSESTRITSCSSDPDQRHSRNQLPSAGNGENSDDHTKHEQIFSLGETTNLEEIDGSAEVEVEGAIDWSNPMMRLLVESAECKLMRRKEDLLLRIQQQETVRRLDEGTGHSSKVEPPTSGSTKQLTRGSRRLRSAHSTQLSRGSALELELDELAAHFEASCATKVGGCPVAQSSSAADEDLDPNRGPRPRVEQRVAATKSRATSAEGCEDPSAEDMINRRAADGAELDLEVANERLDNCRQLPEQSASDPLGASCRRSSDSDSKNSATSGWRASGREESEPAPGGDSGRDEERGGPTPTNDLIRGLLLRDRLALAGGASCHKVVKAEEPKVAPWSRSHDPTRNELPLSLRLLSSSSKKNKSTATMTTTESTKHKPDKLIRAEPEVAAATHSAGGQQRAEGSGFSAGETRGCHLSSCRTSGSRSNNNNNNSNNNHLDDDYDHDDNNDNREASCCSTRERKTSAAYCDKVTDSIAHQKQLELAPSNSEASAARHSASSPALNCPPISTATDCLNNRRCEQTTGSRVAATAQRPADSAVSYLAPTGSGGQQLKQSRRHSSYLFPLMLERRRRSAAREEAEERDSSQEEDEELSTKGKQEVTAKASGSKCKVKGLPTGTSGCSADSSQLSSLSSISGAEFGADEDCGGSSDDNQDEGDYCSRLRMSASSPSGLSATPTNERAGCGCRAPTHAAPSPRGAAARRLLPAAGQLPNRRASALIGCPSGATGPAHQQHHGIDGPLLALLRAKAQRPPPTKQQLVNSRRQNSAAQTGSRQSLRGSLSSSVADRKQQQHKRHSIISALSSGSAAVSRLSHPLSLFSSPSTSGHRPSLESTNSYSSGSEQNNSSNPKYEPLIPESGFKIVVMGSRGSGKTSIIQRFMYNSFSWRHNPTVEDTYFIEFPHMKNMINISISDTSGTYQFPAMRRLAMNSGDAFILVYSVDEPKSFDDLEKLRQSILDERELACSEQQTSGCHLTSGCNAEHNTTTGSQSEMCDMEKFHSSSCSSVSSASGSGLGLSSSGGCPLHAPCSREEAHPQPASSRHWSLASILGHSSANVTGNRAAATGSNQQSSICYCSTSSSSSICSASSQAPIGCGNICSHSNSNNKSGTSSALSSADSSRRSSISAAEAALKTRRTRRPPMVIVANKHDLPEDRHLVNSDEIEALVVIDWNNGFVRASAAMNQNIDEIFQQVLKQARQPPTLTEAIVSKRRKSLPPKLPMQQIHSNH